MPQSIVALVKIRAVHIQNPIRNIMALRTAHCEERAALQLERLPAHQVNDVRANSMHLSAVPLLHRIFVQRIEVFMIAVQEQDSKRQGFQPVELRIVALIAMPNKPKIVVGENVINLERMEKGEVLKTIKKDLAAAGYVVKVWKMFAPDYGIPQRRTRLIIMCVRKDIFDKYGFPEEPEARFKDKHRSIEWAIGDLVDVTDNSVIPNQGDYFGASKAKKGNGQGDESNKKDMPAYTIRANPKSRVQFHYSLDRRLTVRECARIQTFPDDFSFKFSKTVNISQIGNAVPPIMAYLVAQRVKQYLDKIGGVEK